MAPKTKRAKRDEGHFYEYMPGAYANPQDLFPARPPRVTDEKTPEDANQAARRRMVRQLVVLVGLLVLQFILFAFLLHSTVSLG